MTDNARAQLAAAAAEAASQIVAVLDQNPIRGKNPYPLTEVHQQLGQHHATLQRAVQAYPLALAVDADGRPDKLGFQLAELMGLLHHVLVLYRNLTDIPDHLRATCCSGAGSLPSAPVISWISCEGCICRLTRGFLREAVMSSVLLTCRERSRVTDNSSRVIHIDQVVDGFGQRLFRTVAPEATTAELGARTALGIRVIGRRPTGFIAAYDRPAIGRPISTRGM